MNANASRGLTLSRSHPKVAADWDADRNAQLTLSDVNAFSKQRVWWKCPSGHEYEVSVATRVRTGGCKVCRRPTHVEKARRTKLANGRSFSEARPDLLAQWNYERNDLSPDELSEKSHKPVWWRCDQGHEWQSTPQRRARGDGCPTCSRATAGARIRAWRLKKAGHSFADVFPALLAEWDFERNTLDPRSLTPHSNARAHWVCKLGHRWEANIYNRSGNRSGCPQCVPQSSRLELFLLAELRAIFSIVEWRKKIGGRECDLYIPALHFGIEVDGGYWHANKVRADNAKTSVFNRNGVTLLRVRDATLPAVSGHMVAFRNGEDDLGVTLRALAVMATLTHHDGVSAYVHAGVQRNDTEFRTLVARLPAPPAGATLADTDTQLAQEWDSERNGPLVPELFSRGSMQRMHWLCAKGHRWVATIKNRTLAGSGCPKCASDSASVRVRAARLRKSRSIVDTAPHLLARWDYARNETLRPESLSIGSAVSIWWRCELGHSYRRSVGEEAKRKGCPECFRENRGALARRSAANRHGTLADAVKGLPVTLADAGVNLADISAKTRHTFSWRCPRGHTFRREARLVLKNSDCPWCKSPPLAELRPDLVEEWVDPDVSPLAVSAGSDRMVLWRCGMCGHQWRMTVGARVAASMGCPQCRKGNRAESVRLAKLRKSGSLADHHPLVAAQWHPTRNHGLTTHDISSNSHRRVWWQCSRGHEWEQSPNQRVTLRGRASRFGCPICA